jgi:hypothetical protein
MKRISILLSLFILNLSNVLFAENCLKTISDNEKSSNKKYFVLTELNFSPGIGNTIYFTNNSNNKFRNEDLTYGFRIINGIKLKDRLNLGIGGGLLLSKKYNSFPLIPISLDCRIFFLKGINKPYLNLNIGYTLGKNIIGSLEQKGGMLFNPSIGIKKIVYNNLSCMLSLGYCLQFRSLKFDYNLLENLPIPDGGDPFYNYNEKKSFLNQFISINLGFGIN